jgi:hypothetical protein
MQEKEKQNTLDGVEIREGRRVGNTTRQVDKAIEIIMSRKVCVVRDHFQAGMYDNANKLLYNRILNRLSLEHGLSRLELKKKIRYDVIDLEIELL